MATMRLMREYKAAQSVKDKDISLAPVREGDLMLWRAEIQGPPDTPFARGVYVVSIKISPDYPMVAPTAVFQTKVFHPNINYKTGEICLDIFANKWSPAWTLMSVCLAIQALLADHEASSPLNCDAGNICREGDEMAYDSLARMYSVQNARAPPLSW